MSLQVKQLDNSIVFGLVLCFILVLGAWLRWPNLDNLAWNNDEGIYLTAAHLVSQGYTPYSEVSFSQSPLFLELVRWPLAWSDRVTVVRQVLSSFGILLIVVVALMGRDLNGNIAGWSSAIFLALTPSFFYYARAVMADIPSVALGMWAGWAALRFYQTGKRPWLIVSGVLIGLSLAIKILTIYAVGWIILLILYRIWYIERKTNTFQPARHHAIQNVLIFGGCAGLTLLGIVIWYDIPSLWSSVFGMRIAMRKAFGGLFDSNLDVITEFWKLHTPLIILSIYGLLAQLRLPNRAFFLLTWLGLLLLSLLNHTPLHPQHLQLLLPVLTVLAGIGVGHLIEGARTQIAKPTRTQRIWFGVGILLLGWYLFFIYSTRNQTTRFTKASPNPLNDQDYLLVNFLQTFTSPDDCLITDNLILAFVSRRFPPPSLADVSSARLRSGSLTYDNLVSAAQQYNCQVVIPITKRLKRSRPDFLEWTKANFLGLWLYNNTTEIWLGQPLSNSHPTIPLRAILGGRVVLEGADIVEDYIDHDRVLYVSLYWRPLQPLGEDYTIFVHLREANDVILVNADHQPYNNLVPTSRWPVGDVIKESIRLDLSPDISLDAHRLFVGLYRPDTQERLPIRGDNSGENAVIIPKGRAKP